MWEIFWVALPIFLGYLVSQLDASKKDDVDKKMQKSAEELGLEESANAIRQRREERINAFAYRSRWTFDFQFLVACLLVSLMLVILGVIELVRENIEELQGPLAPSGFMIMLAVIGVIVCVFLLARLEKRSADLKEIDQDSQIKEKKALAEEEETDEK